MTSKTGLRLRVDDRGQLPGVPVFVKQQASADMQGTTIDPQCHMRWLTGPPNVTNDHATKSARTQVIGLPPTPVRPPQKPGRNGQHPPNVT
ncbi:hypothetical protein MGG_16366 [Pyricularia oryzae 70-15]|uniref:Uncharacterized protein n=1 Tax=Pyricularia oryzae (strain 70-15 / ATCC MYA-4617 / FGSC 8958) TaxID=242507 RepID=G4MLT0_PYRO7|nr:uncharacterized protein MGG_16366 [Pyricularia oryzae 70-15]EHA57708.1 hypothetical protein MGG_16366 [Pyricularia oryzae 70-15]